MNRQFDFSNKGWPGRETRQPTENPTIPRRLPRWRIIVAASRYSREKESGDSRRDGVS